MDSYTIAIIDEDGIERNYSTFIPDADEDDIKTRTNPTRPDSNTNSKIEG